MGYAVKIYEAFRDLGEDKAAILAEFVEYVESRKAATSQELKETELRLQREIEQVRLELTREIEQVKLEVEQVRKELKETELKLQKDIEQVRLELTKEIEQVRREISETKATLVKWMFLFWTGQLVAIAGLLKLMLR